MSEMKSDSAKIEVGAWVTKIPNLDDLRLKVRGLGNSDYRAAQAQRMQAIPRHRRDTVAEQDKVLSQLLLETVLLDWDGLVDDAGKPVPFARDTAEKLLTDPDFRAFRDGVVWAAASVAEQGVADLEADSKN